ncbi:holo-ACP synthase [Virgibacillus proomii]|jgi:holo-[acyl-carrier protein] synthase|uniref:holo-ACP synthase n=1 Tax=Virgibacillus proomii TaxID=84407 RepID=UPI00098617C6|nr:holo-ACP synthase [Virgibacillus proomii]
MIKGIGIDIIELYRIKQNLERNCRFIERILTPKEREIYASLKTDKRKVEFVAGRFAAKEAFSKAAGTGIGKLSFQDMEVQILKSGAPHLYVKGFEQTNLFLSISHTREYAAAQVIIEEL